MFDKKIFNECLSSYKKNFSLNLVEEKFNEWEVVKCFQDNWDIDAENFYTMLSKSLKKLSITNFLVYQFSTVMIKRYAKNEPETVRQMFANLFDERKNLIERFANFKQRSQILFEKYHHGKEKLHAQSDTAISVYLWLKYPDKYYIYKPRIIKFVAEVFKSSYDFAGKNSSTKIINNYALCDEICAALHKDSELAEIFKSKLTADCYPDPNLKILTTNFIFYVKKKFNPDSVQDDSDEEVIVENSYTKENFLDEVYISAEKYDLLITVLKRKKNIILQGAPGVGKTFAAKRLAYSLIGTKDDAQIEFVQFHQNYSYEDFVMGYRPNEKNFELRHGIFYNFCKKAESELDKDFFFIIDEINRGNLSKIFGELLMLIEKDHRAENIKLAYNGENFSVPQNLYIIGIMNTADRSLALIDYALRRRFSFVEIEPAFDSDGFKNYLSKINSPRLDKLIEKIKILNQEISQSLGKGFCIGHSYFCGLENNSSENILRSIVDYEILPLLAEYFFDDEEKFQDCKNILRGAFDD